MAALLEDAMAHLERLRKELKCPICLRLFNEAANLSCNHCFCTGCIVESLKAGPSCPVCQVPTTRREVRSAPKMDALVNILRSMESSIVTASLVPDDDARTGVKRKKPENVESAEEKRKEKAEGALVKRLHNKKRVQAPELDKIEAVEDVDGAEHTASAGKSRKKRVKAAGEDVQNAPGLDDFEDFTIGQIPSKPTWDVKRCDAASRETCLEKHHEIGRDGVLAPFFWVRDTEEPESPGPTPNPVSQEAGLAPAFSDLKDSTDHNSDAETVMDDATKSEAFFCTQRPCSPELHCTQVPNILIIEDSVPSSEALMDHVDAEQCVDSKGATEANEEGTARGGKGFSQGEGMTCVFCQGSGHSDIAGDIVFHEGDCLVDGRTAADSMAVHKLCAEWAPNVYFTDEGAVRNLETEVTRGQKLKCGLCGLKGAALGCSLKRCRKSFHYPCAKSLSKCQWNLNKYTMRCPDHHAGCKSPVKRKEPAKATTPSNLSPVQTIARPVEVQRSLVRKWPPGPWYNWVLCGSALDTHKKEQLSKFAGIAGAASATSWSHNVTHLITTTDENGAARRTMKYLQAILEGKWILRADWISACLAAGQAVDEAEFEVNRDVHGVLEGPKSGRFMAASMTPKLFGGLSIYFMSQFEGTLKADLQSVVETGGGVVLHRRPVPLSSSPAGPLGSSVLVIFNDELCLNSEQEQQQGRRREAGSVAEPAGALVLGHSWVLNSAAACKLQQPA